MSPEEEGEKRSGIDRRTLIKRSAIVGGLVWVTPVVQSMRIPANAAGVGSGVCDACIATTIGAPPQVAHQTYNASVACCDCIAANGGGFVGLVTCAFVLPTPQCLPFGPVQPGPCP